MSRIDLNDSPYLGTTTSPPWGGPRHETSCRRCGSSLAGRREKLRRETSQGIRYVIETFRCGCGAARQIKREVAV